MGQNVVALQHIFHGTTMGHDAIFLRRMGWDMLHRMRMEMLHRSPLALVQ